MSEEQEKVIEIHVTRWAIIALAWALILVSLPLILTLTDDEAVADHRAGRYLQAGGPRSYYLTKTGAFPHQAPTHCAMGYHMASLWEIADPSNLSYNTTLGRTSSDSGSGPSTELPGWVRTGYVANTSNTPGRGNCDGWQSFGVGHYGTRGQLVNNWTGGAEDLGAWDLSTVLCNNPQFVWCVEDL